MSIRKGTWHDWARINEIFRKELPYVTSEERHYVIQALLDGTWVWESHGVVWGFAMTDELKYHSASWIDYVAVISSMKGLGIGTALMSRCQDEAKVAGKSWMALSTFENNGEAIRFYSNLGYSPHPDVLPGKVRFTKSLRGETQTPELTPSGSHPSRLKMRLRRLLFDYAV